MKKYETDITEQERIAIRSMLASEFWPVVENMLKRERNIWLEMTRDSVIYQNHAELTSACARVAEVDWILDTFDLMRPKSDSPSVIQ